MERKTYRCCIVSGCGNTSVSTPDKLFIPAPRKAETRIKWLQLARRKNEEMYVNSLLYFCEDHFDLPRDMENYMRYHVMGYVKKIIIKPGCLPTKFNFQNDGKKSIGKSCSKQRQISIQDALDKRKFDNNKEGTTLSSDVHIDVVRVEPQLKPPDGIVSKMTKTNSEKCKDYYNRNKIEKKRQVAARVRAHRLRQKLIAQNGTPTDDLSRFIITSDTLVIRPGPQCQPAPCEINGTLPARKRIKQENSEITTPQELHNSGEDFNSAMKDLRSKPIESLEATNTLPQEEVTLECRACYQKFDYDAGLVDLFQSWNPPWNGMADTIAEDLSKLTSIEVSLSDPYSKYICLMCHQKLLDACNFVANVRLNDRVFREKAEEVSREETIWPKPIQVDKDVNSLVLNNSMVVEVKQEVLSEDEADVNGTDDMYKENDFNSMEIKVEPEEIVEQSAIQITVNGTITLDQFAQNSMVMNGDCISEDQKTEDVKVKQEPKSDDEESETVPDLSLECMLCTKNFNSVSGLKAHVVSQHSYKSVKRKTEGGSSPKKKNRHTCATCRSSFVTSTDLMVHETRHNAYACYVCSDKFDTFELLTKHRKKCKPAGSNTVLKPKTLEDVKRPYVSSPHLSEASELDVEMKVEPLDNSFSEDEVIN